MTDERYEFISDLREKKATARSARNRRTHTGRGGRVRLPSDNLTAKELNAMNGKVESYKLNAPMSWAEFKVMPEDLRVSYIKLLRQKFNVPNTYLAEMFGVTDSAVNLALKKLGLGQGKRSGIEKWDKEGWVAWVNGVKVVPVGESDITSSVTAYAVPPSPQGEGLGAEDDVTVPEEVEADPQEKALEAEGGGAGMAEKSGCVRPDWEGEYAQLLTEHDGLLAKAAYIEEENRDLRRQIEVLRAQMAVVEMIFGRKCGA